MIALRISVASTTGTYLTEKFATDMNTYLLCEDRTIVYNWDALQNTVEEIQETMYIELPKALHSTIRINVRRVEV